MTWETVIGLETHAELATRTKIFCSCTTRFGGEPNMSCKRAVVYDEVHRDCRL